MAAFIIGSAERSFKRFATVGRNQQPLTAGDDSVAAFNICNSQCVIKNTDTSIRFALVAKLKCFSFIDQSKNNSRAVLLVQTYGILVRGLTPHKVPLKPRCLP